MGADFRQRRQAEPFGISAAEFNAMLLAGKSVIRGQRDQPGPLESSFDPVVIEVNNASGSDVARAGVLGIDVPSILPSSDADRFASRVLVDGKTPATASHIGKFVVLIEPIKDGSVGRAVISGVVPVTLVLTTAGDEWAEIDDGSAAHLKSGPTGSAQIMWKESNTPGTMWALVRIGNVAGGKLSSPPTVGASTTGDTALTDSWNIASPPSGHGVKLTIMTRSAYNSGGDQKLYGFFRDLQFDDKGMLQTISAETRVTIDTPDSNCSPP